MAHKIYVEQENGKFRTINITELGITESGEQSINPESDRESYGIKEDAIAHLQEVHETIQLYTRYAIGAFTNLSDIEVEEVKIKFGIKIWRRSRYSHPHQSLSRKQLWNRSQMQVSPKADI